MENNNNLIIISIVAVFVLICGAIGYIGVQQVVEENPNFWNEVEAQRNDPAYIAQLDAENQEMADKTFPFAVGGFVLFLIFVFGQELIHAIGKPLLILTFGIVLLGGIAYFFGYADKNGDGQNDVQIIRMIQPSGSDKKTDKAYSEINNTNAEATMKNSASLSVIWIVFAICVFLFGFVAQFFRNTDYE